MPSKPDNEAGRPDAAHALAAGPVASLGSTHDRADVVELELRYWSDVDRRRGELAAMFYVEDGVFEIDARRMVGRGPIADFYRWRENRGDRQARHLISNPIVEITGAGAAVLVCTMTLYGADGKAPARLPSPLIIADVISHCVRDELGVWRYRLHRLATVFVGAQEPPMPPMPTAS